MELTNILNIIDTIKMEEQIVDNVFKEKLNELRLFQEKTEERKDTIFAELFPEKLYRAICNCTYTSEYSKRKNKAIKIEGTEGELVLYCYEGIVIEINNTICKINATNKFNEIFDWWANKTYVDSHMVERFKLLKKENEILDILENNIAQVYKEIAERIEIDMIEKRQKTANSLVALNKTTSRNNGKKQTITITIQIEE